MAHKKAAGSAKNLRTSKPKYRGVKLFGGQTARAGNIVIRQKGDVYQLGKNVYKGSDFTIHAAIDGVVMFRKKNIKRFDGGTYLKTVVDVMPMADVSAAGVASKSTTTKAKAVKSSVVVSNAEMVSAEMTHDAAVDGDIKENKKEVSAKKSVAKISTDKTKVAEKPAKESVAKPASSKSAAKPAAKRPAAKPVVKKT